MFNGKIVNGFCLCVDILSVQSNKIKPYLPVLYKASEAIFFFILGIGSESQRTLPTSKDRKIYFFRKIWPTDIQKCQSCPNWQT